MNTVTGRLFAAFLAIIALVLLTVSLALVVLLRSNPLIERQTYTRLNNVASLAVRQLLLSTGVRGQAQDILDEIAADHGVRALLTTADGGVLFDTALLGQAPINFRGFRAARPDEAFPNARIGQARDARQRLWLYVTYSWGPGSMLVVASRPTGLSALLFFRQNLLQPMLQAALVAAVMAGALSILIARSIAQPLARMAALSQGIARGDYAQTAPETGPKEVRSLASALNNMARQVQSTQQGQRDFLANVSHELRTPLTSIQGFAQAMLDGTVDSPAGRERSAQIIFDEAERMRRLVDGLLELARLDSNLRALARAPVDPRALLARVVEKFGLRAQSAGVSLQAQLPAGLPAVLGDGDRLAQVFDNLLDNALKHTPAGGRVVVTAETAPGGLNVHVADTGRGIPAEDLDRIFERFYQVDKSRTHGGGLGLGLSISREIVAAHGGQIQAHSRPGEGTTLTVSLPAGPTTTRPGHKA
ncbi:MAG: HAMP domain-containing histidine kinase [Anaerolineales bacterium]|nr:HAMP domain-containing histidine kinase [Anaerolineales bacterium]